jgi:hypothetical protein
VSLFVHIERTVLSHFCNESHAIRSVVQSPVVIRNSRPSSSRVSTRSLMGSPCDVTLIRKVDLPARTRCVSRQTFSRRMSASGAVASVAFPPCPTHFLTAHKTAALSPSPNSGLFELVPSSSLRTRAHLSASQLWNLQHPEPIFPTLHDPSTPNPYPPSCQTSVPIQ